MKNKLNKFLGIFILALATIVLACDDEETVNIIEPEAAFVLEQSTASNVLLNFGLPDNPAFTVTWSDPVTGSTNYDIEMDINNDFSNPIMLGSSSTNSFSINVMDLNSAIISTGTAEFDGLTVYVRALAGGAISNTVTYSITAYPTEGGVAITDPSNGDSFVLSIGSVDDVILDMQWADALPEAIGSVDYVIESALAGTDFATIVVIGTGTDISSLELTHSALNAVALGLGLPADTAGDVDIRIRATTTNDNGTLLERISETTTISITPYAVSFPNLYLVGNATTPDWNNNNNNTAVFRNQDVPNNYIYTGYFNTGEFKLLEVLGQWQPQWGTNDGTTLAVNPGGGSDPGAFSVATAGYYTYDFTVVDEGGSFTVTPYDASGDPTYSTMGLIGDATPNGWDGSNDTNFTQDANNPHLWYINNVTLTNGGQFLIRANDVWPGEPNAAVWRYTGSSETYGQSNLDNGGGDNFPFTLPTGSYNVWFNDLDGRYVIIPN
ncbi:SusE domain-containing protein [Winogradskyella sp.]|uniref:SusE domain-containing protein n=1 Tax=Winogradskyella sp. TaxID=1883156 RepID=UPI00262EDB12|nr:SusE domain-containing protein [Winogradskyella sp.]